MKKAVIFDLDGTLLDTLSDLTDSVNVTLAAFSRPERTEREVSTFVGNGVRRLIERAFGDATDTETVDRAFRYYIDYYGSHASIKTHAYAGVPECLSRLKKEGYTLAVLSNKTDAFTKQLTALYFPETFDLVQGQKDGIKRKPAPDALFDILKALSIERNNAVFVGDSDVDIETAQNASLPHVAVTWGLRTKDLLSKVGATCFAENGEELYQRIIEIL